MNAPAIAPLLFPPPQTINMVHIMNVESKGLKVKGSKKRNQCANTEPPKPIIKAQRIND